MGLLENLDPSTETGQRFLGLLAAAGPQTDPTKTSYAARLKMAEDGVQDWKRQQQADAYKKLQIEEQTALMQQAKRERDLAPQFYKPASEQTFDVPVNAPNDQGPNLFSKAPSNMVSQQVLQVPASFDYKGYTRALSQFDPLRAYEIEQKMKPAPIKLSAGEAMYDQGGKKLFENPKENATPAEIQGYQLALKQGYGGTFLDYQLAQKRAGASNTLVKVDNKMGESLAGQVGPMAKDSRIQAQGAVKMFDAAERLESALNSNKVTSGPLASKIQTVKQFAQVVGGGNDEGIRQTNQAIKSLAQMAVEARKQLQGQGQVTDAEAKAVAKADAGDIDSLTTGELRDLVVLTKRAAHFQAKSHQDLMGTLGSKPETQGLVPFYGVQGLDPLLQHKPTLPQIGGNGWGIKEVK